MFRRFYRWIASRYRLDLKIVCEESAGRGMLNDFHDYPDSDPPEPWHWHEHKCRRCGKLFQI